MKLFVLFNSTIPMSLIGSHTEKLISKLSYTITHTPNQSISTWLNFHKFVTLAPAGKNKFAMANLHKELTELAKNGQYVVESSNTENDLEYAVVSILLPSTVYNIGPKLLQDSQHNYILKENGETMNMQRMVSTMTVENADYPKNDVKLVQLLQKFYLNCYL